MLLELQKTNNKYNGQRSKYRITRLILQVRLIILQKNSLTIKAFLAIFCTLLMRFDDTVEFALCDQFRTRLFELINR